jgi:hypothetical protein
MKFVEIKEGVKVTPGEYIFHAPSNQIVLCGAFNRQDNKIRVLAKGKMFTDTISNFKKISMTSKERRESKKSSSCGGCKSKRSK